MLYVGLELAELSFFPFYFLGNYWQWWKNKPLTLTRFARRNTSTWAELRHFIVSHETLLNTQPQRQGCTSGDPRPPRQRPSSTGTLAMCPLPSRVPACLLLLHRIFHLSWSSHSCFISSLGYCPFCQLGKFHSPNNCWCKYNHRFNYISITCSFLPSY